MDTDEKLFVAIKAGDKKAFDMLFIKYFPMLCAYARQFLSQEESEDIVQDVMMEIWEKRQDIEIKTSASSYLFGAVRNRCISYCTNTKRRGRIHRLIFEDVQEQIEDSDYYAAKELYHRLQAALKKLPPTYREAFELNRFEGKTYQQIAEKFGVSSKTIDYRICKSLKILREELKDFLPVLMLLVFQLND